MMDEDRRLSLTAVFLKNSSGYTGYVVELPGVNSHGKTIERAREALRELVALVFEEERRSVAESLAGKEVQREAFLLGR
jgi:predicted RNase H-like HicB family nuclease